MPEARDELTQALAGPSPPPVVLIAGADAELRHEALQAILGGLDDDQRATGVDRFEQAPIHRVLDAARTPSLLGGGRTVVAVDPPGLVTSDEAAREALSAYLEAPAAGSTLVLVVDKLDRRLKLAKQVEKIGLIVPCEPPREREMPSWIAARAQRLGLRLAPDAIQLLADAVGTDTGLAVRELEKIALVAVDGGLAAGGTVRAPDVEPLLGPTRSVGAFALEDALLGGHTGQALDALERHLVGRDAAAPLALLARLATISRRLVVAADALRERQDPEAVRTALGCHPFVAKKYASAAREAGQRRGERGLAACVAADARLKSGEPPYAALSRVVLMLAPVRSGKRRRAP
jgi:DNA polymerase-3 subunit delta